MMLLLCDTESLKQAVGHEAIKLLVSVDEDDYESGRLLLLGNLTDWESTGSLLLDAEESS